MIQIDEKELQVLVELANRAPKSRVEQYALETIVEKLNETQQKRQAAQPVESGGKVSV